MHSSSVLVAPVDKRCKVTRHHFINDYGSWKLRPSEIPYLHGTSGPAKTISRIKLRLQAKARRTVAMTANNTGRLHLDRQIGQQLDPIPSSLLSSLAHKYIGPKSNQRSIHDKKTAGKRCFGRQKTIWQQFDTILNQTQSPSTPSQH